MKNYKPKGHFWSIDQYKMLTKEININVAKTKKKNINSTN